MRKSFSLLKKEDISVLRIRSSNYAAVVGGETNYFRYLDNLHVEYILPVREIASKLNVGQTALKYLTINLDNILQEHRNLQMKLQSLLENPLFPMKLPLGELLINESSEIRTCYMTFATNFVASLETFRYLCRVNPAFSDFIEEVSSYHFY